MKAAEIYSEIVRVNKIDPVDEESYVRNLRNKMTFIIENVVLRKVSSFKQRNCIVIPDNDAPIVRNLIMASLNRDEYPWVSDWFNKALDLSDALTCQCIFMSVGEPIMRAEIMGETDDVTVNEWLATIKGVLNVDMAANTIRMKQKLENFRSRTLVINNTVRMGDIIVGHEDGSRSYGLKGEHKPKVLSEEVLKQIVDGLQLQNDYFYVLGQILDYMVHDAECKAIPAIEFYARVKNLSDCESAIGVSGVDSMASEYSAWFKKIAEFLRQHPDEAKRIEEMAKIKDLEKFFS